MKLLIVCPYPHGKAPSQRFRFEQYLDYLDAEYTVASFWRENEWPGIYKDTGLLKKIVATKLAFIRRLFLLFTVGKYDRVFIHREATPIGLPWFEWAVAKIFRKPIVFDFDDAIWLPNSSDANRNLVGRFKNHGKTAKICSWSKTVIVGNAYLEDYAKKYASDVRKVPTTIDTEGLHKPLRALFLEVDEGSEDGTQDSSRAPIRLRRSEPASDEARNPARTPSPKGDQRTSEEGDVNSSHAPIRLRRSERSSEEGESQYPSHAPAPKGGQRTDKPSQDSTPEVDEGLEDGTQDSSHAPAPKGGQPTDNPSRAPKGDQRTSEEARNPARTPAPKGDQRTSEEGDVNSSHAPVRLRRSERSSEEGESQYPMPNTQYPLITIGWTGTHSTLKQLVPLFPVLEALHAETEFDFILIADQAPDYLPDFVEFKEWNKETEIDDLLRIDIGIMPLFDSAWERGKCGFKALQYMALSIPTVVSPVAVNAEIVRDGLEGFHAEVMPPESSEIWKNSLKNLLNDVGLRKSLGEAGRKRVEEFYSVKAWRGVYQEVLSSSGDPRGRG